MQKINNHNITNMKNIKLFLSVICGMLILSCNQNSERIEKENNSTSQKISKIDSFKQAEKLAIQQLEQDSIEALQIRGYSVKKISGKHKYGGKTTIEYKSLMQLIAETKKQADKEMWTKNQLDVTLMSLKKLSIGGQVRLDIERTTIGSANTEFFTIIVKDSAENEVFRKTFDSSVPNPSSLNDNWWNIALCSINKRIKTPFYIYIVDALEDAPFKFEVTTIKK